MNQHVVLVLEFDKILERLAENTSFQTSRRLALSLRPKFEPEDVLSSLALTTEGRWLADNRPDIRIAGASDVIPMIERSTLGGVLEPSELLEIKSTIVAAHRLRAGLPKTRAATPRLSMLANIFPVLGKLEQEINKCLNERGEVMDTASLLLGRLRADVRVAHRRVIDRLEQIMRDGIRSGFIQEPIITQRSGRHVLSVKAGLRQHLDGIIHDQSASGATDYIEPIATIEMANSLRKLQIEEKHETRRILNDLATRVGANAPALTKTVELLAEIDLALAAGLLSAKHRASEPQISPRGDYRKLRLVNARHPLLDESVVPIDFKMDQGHRIVVITGPNTGGKTVALKTVGLLTLMAQSGLHVPADPGSQLVIFKQLFTDIGDEQSIERSLSTFSSHMTRVIEALNSADENTLILLDEIGAGTDPDQGSALARATMSRLLAEGSWVVATTHFGELKVFAHETPSVVNAAVEFNPETLAPTYRLVLGIPGISNAFDIARRLGLDASILADARAMLGGSQLSLEGLLQTTRRELESANKLHDEARAARQEAKKMKRELAQRLAQIEAERPRAVEVAWQKAAEELDEIRHDIRVLGNHIKRNKPQINRVVATRKVRKLAKQLAAHTGPSPGPDQESIRLKQVGDYVTIRHLQQSGVVTSISHDGTSAEVQLANARLRAPTSQLEPAGRVPMTHHDISNRNTVSFLPGDVRPTVASDIDLRGYRAEDIGPALERHLNDAFMDGVPSVRIIHGKGAGTLRRVVREHLGHHPIVTSACAAPQSDGGEGVTVIELGL